MVKFMKRYLKRLKEAEEDAGVGFNLSNQPNWYGPLFPRAKVWKNRWIPCRFEDPVSYSTALRRLKKVAQEAGIQKFGLHSSRRGAATTLVKASAEKGEDFSDRLLKSAGR